MRNSVVLALAALLLVGCDPNSSLVEREPNRSGTNILVETSYDCSRTGFGSLITVSHDGHLFVVEGRYQKGGILHHPSCPCFTNTAEKAEK